MARGATSISGAIDFGRRLLMTAPFVAARKVIDISGDGKNNHGASWRRPAPRRCSRTSPSTACRWCSRTGTRPPDLWNDVEHYYRDCVIGGVGAFMVPVYRTAQFADAIRDKLVREIASPAPDPAFAGANSEPRVDCREGAGKGPMR